MRMNSLPSINERKRDFRERVRYASAAFMRREDSRKFDNCFEMYDGSYVVTALMRKAETDAALRAAICHDFGCAWADLPWQKTYQKNMRLSDSALADAAAQTQIEQMWLTQHVFIPQLQEANRPGAMPFKVKRIEGELAIEESIHAQSLRDAIKIVRSWLTRTVMGHPYFSFLAEVTIATETGEEQHVTP